MDQFHEHEWRDCAEFLFGIDLFNASFYWESHVQWEAIWHAVGRSGDIGDFLKGLIKLAAAGVKVLEHRPTGVQRHARRAAELFDRAGMRHSMLCGLCVGDLQQAALEVATRSLEQTTQLPIILRPN